jgi:uncharacterized tellurite resistance protein B-like protein
MRAPLIWPLIGLTLALTGCASQGSYSRRDSASRSGDHGNETQLVANSSIAVQSTAPTNAPESRESAPAVKSQALQDQPPKAQETERLIAPTPTIQTPVAVAASKITIPAPAPVTPTPVASFAAPEPSNITESSDPTLTRSVLQIGVPAAVLLVIFAIFLTRYLTSTTFKARQRLRGYCRRIEDLMKAQAGLLKMEEKNVADIAGEYIREERNLALQAISLDQIRRLAGGARMQPLVSVGVANLLDLQGWTAESLQRLRGIGPDSAYKIMSAKVTLTKDVQGRPLRRPGLAGERATGLKLYARIYILFREQEILEGQQEALAGKLTELRQWAVSVNARTGFFQWLFHDQSKGAVREAIEDVSKIDAMMSGGGSLREMIQKGDAQLEEARAAGRVAVSPAVLSADVSNNGDLYSKTLDSLLGARGRGLVSPSAGDAPSNPQRSGTPAMPVSFQFRGDPSPTFAINRGRGIGYEIRGDGEVIDRDPSSPTREPQDCWLPKGREVGVAGFKISGGLIYVGRGLPSLNRQSIEPALVDPALPVVRTAANCHERMLDYWSSYRFARPEARASYLQWHETGRSDPEADVGYVFLYFYGLERRALSDPAVDQSAIAETPMILDEVRRLRSIYSTNRSFDRYSSAFLDYLESVEEVRNGSTGQGHPPALERGNLTFSLRKGLGSFASTGESLPASWAFAWFHNDPRTRIPGPVERCSKQFEALFTHEYERRFAPGIILPSNKTRMRITYKPASASFGRLLSETLDLPDVAVLSTTYSKLNAVAQDCFERLDAFGRFIGRNGDSEVSVEAIVLQPAILWPDPVKPRLDRMKSEIGSNGEPKVIKLSELIACFGDVTPISKTAFASLAAGLADIGIGIAPDVRVGGVAPAIGDLIALYQIEAAGEAGEGYGLALLMLQLSSYVASADGTFSDSESAVLRQQIEGNNALSVWERRQLVARMAIYRRVAPSISGVKKVIEGLDSNARKGVIDALFATVYANGTADPSEVKALEKIYSLFGIASGELYTRLHAMASGPDSPKPMDGRAIPPFKLDMAKVEKLKAASAEVTNRLKVIFNSPDEEDTAGDIKVGPAEASAIQGAPTILGLDQEHSDLLTVLLSRSHWSRAEFLELCTDKSLMPDGAIERINEAAFEKFGQPMIEGDESLEVASQLLAEEKTK